MLYYDRIDVSERIDVSKTSWSNECNVCHYWYFLDYSFKVQRNVCKKYNIFLKAYIKMEKRQLQNLMILKSQNKSFINIKDLFQ